MPWIEHPECQGAPVSVIRWLRYYIGVRMQEVGRDWEDRALYPKRERCRECGQWVRPGDECDHLPF